MSRGSIEAAQSQCIHCERTRSEQIAIESTRLVDKEDLYSNCRFAYPSGDVNCIPSTSPRRASAWNWKHDISKVVSFAHSESCYSREIKCKWLVSCSGAWTVIWQRLRSRLIPSFKASGFQASQNFQGHGIHRFGVLPPEAGRLNDWNWLLWCLNCHVTRLHSRLIPSLKVSGSQGHFRLFSPRRFDPECGVSTDPSRLSILT